MKDQILIIYEQYKQLIEKASKKFYTLSDDEIYSCNLTAIQKTIAKFNKNDKYFPRYLKLRILWELGDYLREELKQTKNIVYTDNTIARTYLQDTVLCDFFIDAQKSGMEIILRYKCEYKMTNSEIGKKVGCSRETIRKKINLYLSTTD